jgi:MFS family permease
MRETQDRGLSIPLTQRHIEISNTLKQAIFMISLPFGVLFFVLPVYGKEIGAGAVQIGLFFSVFSLMTVLLRPVVGVGLDRYGRRPFFLIGLTGYAVTMFAFAFSDQVWVIVVARVFQGGASAFLWLAVSAITADVAGAGERGRIFGGVDQSRNQGAILGALVGFSVLTQLADGWKLLFIAYGSVGLAAVWLSWRRLPETIPTTSRRRVDNPIVWSRPWVLLLVVTAVTAASWMMVSPILMIFLQEKLAADVGDLALAYLPAVFIEAFLPGRLGTLADRFGRKPLMVLGLAVAAGSSFIIPGLASLEGLAILWALQALCHAAGDPAEQALVADLTDNDQRGRAFGLYALASGLGATAGPLAGGWLYESVGPQGPFFANGVVLALCALVLWGLLPERVKCAKV